MIKSYGIKIRIRTKVMIYLIKTLLLNLFFESVILLNICNAQNQINTIYGKIVNTNGKPVSNVNVFLNNTTIGTTTDKNGLYTLKNIPSGNYELVVSHAAYKLQFNKVTMSNTSTIKLDFSLEEKMYPIEEVYIESKIPEKWYDQIKIFKKYFLGRNEFTEDCKFINEYVVNFAEPKDGILQAFTDSILVVENYALGYKLDIILLFFEYVEENEAVKFLIKTRFSELDSPDDSQKEKWGANRSKVYLGSPNHFFSSLVNGTTALDGFNVYSQENLFKRATPIDPVTIIYYDELLKKYIIEFDGFTKIIYEPETYKSWIYLEHGSTYLDDRGILTDPLEVDYLGEWSKIGASKILPINYEEE